ncbi:MAG TPA: SDR family NAD(P)-dependent oxidoreductase [Candidatus Binatia bacterium]|jgi:3alpha(or 20beta)-hydroxysteroid dehydrogenase|nr:SDR family NAD(P)-dependent oxidoreductase [Candidatus Binatia bacterium]
MARRLNGEVALITGAARGQGEAEAQLFAQEGAHVVLADIRDELGQQVAWEIGPRATYVHLDVSQAAQWQTAVETTVQTYGKLTILVNNAGIGLPDDRSIEETSLDTWHKTIAVNQTGVFLGMKYAIPAMRTAGGGADTATLADLKPSGGVHARALGSSGRTRVLKRIVCVTCKPGRYDSTA